MLKIDKLSVSYGSIPALRGVSFEVNDREIVALIGPNGAGKTTAMKAISGLLKRGKGTVVYNGKDISSVPAHRLVKEGIVQVPEGRGVFPNLTVLENINLGGYLQHEKDSASMRKRVFEIFPRLNERQKQISGTLSGGEQQMLAIARALMAQPKLLLLDEPSMGLSPLIVEEIFRVIKRINSEQGTTILLVEQNAKMALAVSHRAYVVEVGEIIFEGTSRELRSDDRVRQAYLGI